MSRETTVSDSVVIAVDPVEIWRQLADPTQMPRWSTENTGARTGSVGRPLVQGEVFDGTNRRGRARWSTQCVVRHSVPGERFCFDVRRIGLGTPRLPGRIARWDYVLVSVAGGTEVSETWTDGRRGWPDWLAAVFDRTVTGGRLFSDFQRRNIARTLAALKADLESAGDADAVRGGTTA